MIRSATAHRPGTRSRLSALLVATGVIALAALMTSGCAPKDRSGLPEAVPGTAPAIPVSPGSDGGDLDGATDAPSTDAEAGLPDASVPDAGECLSGATLAMDAAFGGGLAVRGTLTVPAPLPAGRTLILSVSVSSGETRTQTFYVAAVTDRFTFRVGGLAAGSYVVRVQADVGGNGAINDPGDYDGYYDGTASGPILLRADAKVFTLTTQCVDKLDFGAGVKP